VQVFSVKRACHKRSRPHRREVIVAGGSDGTVWIWNAAGHPVRRPLTGHTDEVRAVAVACSATGTFETIQEPLEVWEGQLVNGCPGH
jgi:WD40 repeat protein